MDQCGLQLHETIYLSIMALSVSSECAFSQCRITISKQHYDLLFHKLGLSSIVEDELDKFKIEDGSGENRLGEKADDLLDKDENEAWDGLLLNGDRPGLKILQAKLGQNITIQNSPCHIILKESNANIYLGVMLKSFFMRKPLIALYFKILMHKKANT
jgi:hypothetical protein